MYIGFDKKTGNKPDNRFVRYVLFFFLFFNIKSARRPKDIPYIDKLKMTIHFPNEMRLPSD